MKKATMIVLIVTCMSGLIIFTSNLPAVAAGHDPEIELLKTKLLEIERKRNAEINELKKRIEVLEIKRAQRMTSSKEVGELKKTVSKLKSKVENNDTFLGGLTKFVKDHKLKSGLRLQTWYQFVEDGKNGGTENLHDFMIRRFYFYLKGEVVRNLGFFTHIAADRIGQDGLNNSGMGLGTGIAVRDAWIYYNLCDTFKIQMGRMYVPFTRNYGTTSTFAMLPLELPFNQGGVRGGIFYASKVGRDDGLLFWGNPFEGKFQYRLGISEGVEGNNNPNDNLRFTGRISFNLLDPETSWFNKGTYLGEKKVLALGTGYDFQKNLTLNGIPGQDNLGWTVDVFFDHPVGKGAITAEAAYINVHNVTQTLKYSWLIQGNDAHMYYIQGGYLFPWEIGPGKLQPYFRYERLDVKDQPDTAFPSLGLNYYLKGHNAKLTVDWTLIDQRESRAPLGSYSGKDQNLFTIQVTAGL